MEPTWQFTHLPTSPTSPPSSTNAPGKGSATTPRHSVSPKKQPPHQPAEIASQARSKCPHDTHVLHRLIESAGTHGASHRSGHLGQSQPSCCKQRQPPSSPTPGVSHYAFHLLLGLGLESGDWGRGSGDGVHATFAQRRSCG